MVEANEDDREPNQKSEIEVEALEFEGRTCVDCSLSISASARKCPHCHSYQKKWRHVLTLAPAFSLLVAILALLPTTVALIVGLFSERTPQYSVLTFSVDNIAGPNGRLDPPLDFSIEAQLTNLSDEALVVDDSLECNLREAPTVQPQAPESEANQQDPSFPTVVIIRQVGFELYFENSEKTVIAPRSTETVSWEITDDQFLEFNPYETWDSVDLVKFSRNDLHTFYDHILYEFEPLRDPALEWMFPRDSRHEDNMLSAFFLNLDCGFQLENAYGSVNEQLHLEFELEYSSGSFSVDQGVYPRWHIGKNIGGWGGFGNGAG